MNMCSLVRGTGGHLPDNVLTNHDLADMIDTDDEWVRARTGISRRHIAADGENTSDLAVAAALKALEAAGMTAKDIDMVLVSTTTPDLTFPSTASIVQYRLGIDQGSAFDLQAVCCGFVYALATADALLSRGVATRALVIGAETMSRIIDWSDRATCVLFGDGAGAVVLEAVPENLANGAGIKQVHLRSDGALGKLLYVDGGPSATQSTGHLRMDGTKIFRHAVTKISSSVHIALKEANISIDDIDWFVPHQSNQRIINAIAKYLGVSDDRIISTIAEHGNTSAASVPLALDMAVREGKIRSGDLVLAEAVGGGLTWGTVIFRM